MLEELNIRSTGMKVCCFDFTAKFHDAHDLLKWSCQHTTASNEASIRWNVGEVGGHLSRVQGLKDVACARIEMYRRTDRQTDRHKQTCWCALQNRHTIIGILDAHARTPLETHRHRRWWSYAHAHITCSRIAPPIRLQSWSNWPPLLKSLVLHHTAPSGCFWPAKIPFCNILFFSFFFSHNTLILRHAHLAVGNHPEIEKEKKDVCSCTRRGSNTQCFDRKSTAQTTTPYRHTHARTHARTRAHTHTQTALRNTQKKGTRSTQHSHTCIHTHTHTHAHTHTHTRPHTCIHAPPHAHTHAHTRTHAPSGPDNHFQIDYFCFQMNESVNYIHSTVRTPKSAK